MLESVREFMPGAMGSVYDLGWTDNERLEIQRARGFGRWTYRRFEYERYPAHYDIRVRCGEYAWKPAIVREVAGSTNARYLCWLDAGCKVTGDFSREIDIACRVGVYSSVTKGTLGEYTDHRTLEALGVLPEDYDVQMRAACGLVFDLANVRALKIIRQWAAFAKVQEIIAPEGCSPAKKHRYDQSLYTALTRDMDRGRHNRWSWIAHQDCDTGSTRNRRGYAE